MGPADALRRGGDGDALLEAVKEILVDVVLLDISMPGPGCLELIQRLRAAHPRIAIVVLTAHSERGYALRILRAGASSFLTKGCSPSDLTEGIRRAATGAKYVTPSVGEELANALAGGGAAAHESLSDREFEVLRLMASGLRVKEIAARLAISPKTVSTYRARIKEKMGMSGPAEAIRYAIEEGLVD